MSYQFIVKRFLFEKIVVCFATEHSLNRSKSNGITEVIQNLYWK